MNYQPVAASQLATMVGSMFDVANADGSHQLTWTAGYRLDIDAYEVVATCRDCNTTWKHGSAMSAMLMSDYLLAELVPWLGDIMREECGLAVKRILLAEYVTEQLAEAGATGVALADLIGALIVDLEAPGGDVADMIRRLGFDSDGERLRLPEGHPMREGW